MTVQDEQRTPDDIRSLVREQYGRMAASSCCESGAAARDDRVIRQYDASDVTALPGEVTDLAMGSGDPVTLARLQPGQTVLDLGSGGGIDCFLAANRVGETGRVIGVDMTAEMIEKARANQARLGTQNVEFRLGEIEHLPVADASVDIIISNCVINLSPDKPQVFREAYRVLKPGGRLAISDIMTDGPLPDAIKNSLSAWVGCIGGALDFNDYLAAIEAAGFVDVELERVYPDQALKDEELKRLGLNEEGKAGRYAIIKAGDRTEVIELDDTEGCSDRQLAFSGKVTARKPLM